jgi:hypothetical protein
VVIIIYLRIKFITEVMKIKEICLGYFKSLNRDMMVENRVSGFVEDKQILKRIGYL